MIDATGRRRLSRRQRQVIWTGVFVAVGLTSCALALVALNRHRQAVRYEPGEASEDITQALAQEAPPEAPRPKLVDVTREAGLGEFVTFAGQRSSQLPEDMGPGAAWGDYDNDGDDDLFLVSAGGALTVPPEQRAPSLLFENLGNSRFRSVDGFPDLRIVGMGAAFGDADGDGWLDLVVTGHNTLLLLRNDDGRFTLDPRFANRPGFWAGANWGDYDNDGRLDLYVCGYVKYVEGEAERAKATDQYGVSVPYTLNPVSYEPERNLLFRNIGDGRFAEVAEKLGVANPDGRSLSAMWHDFDDDGWLDLYVANDVSDNKFFRNAGGRRFEDVSTAAWVADYRGAMGLTAGDWNRDGDDDLFITHWLAQENALYDSLLKQTGAQPATRSTGTVLERAGRETTSPAGLRFVDAADTVGLGQIALPVVGWGTEFVDLDADGWLDLVVANGSTLETGETPRRLKPQNGFLFWNRRGEYFHDLAPSTPALKHPYAARGLAVSDFDGDGDVDVLISRHGQGVQLLRNEMQAGHWLEIRLRARPLGDGPAVVAVGATAVAHVGAVELRHSVTSASYLSQSSSLLHFGLGRAAGIDRLDVRWRGSKVATYTALAADRVWEITEGDPVPREISRGPRPAHDATPTAGMDERQRLVAFWERHRAAMAAMKVDHDIPRAVALFREALALDPAHEDARYYLGHCLAEQGDVDGALGQYEELIRRNPRSHRAYARLGTLRAMTARSTADFARAEEALAAAYRLNPEETGVLLTLGEIGLMRGQPEVAEQRLSSACRTNPRATVGLFLLGYLHWKRGDSSGAEDLLKRVRAALGPEWKPTGATAEGDVTKKAHAEETPLSPFAQQWDGASPPRAAYARLDAHLQNLRRGSPPGQASRIR